jgi:hypothetical protein
MSFGLEIWNSAGISTLNSTMTIHRVVMSVTVPALAAGGSYFVTVAGMTTSNDWLVHCTNQPVWSAMGLYSIIGNGGFTVYSGYTSSASGTWIVLRMNGGASSGFGFSVFNDLGGCQIDQDYRNYVKIGSGTNVASATDITKPAGTLILAVRPTTIGASITLNTNDFLGCKTSSGTWDWVAYGLPTEYVTGYGLQVYRSDGSVAFNSEGQGQGKTMVGLGTINYTWTTGETHSIPNAIAGLRPYIPIHLLTVMGGVFPRLIFPNVRFDSSSVYITHAFMGYGAGSFGPWGPYRNMVFFGDI